MKQLFALTALGLALTTGACTTSPTHLKEGTYESSSESVDANGTKRTSETVTEVDKDGYGNKKAVVKTKTTRDPKGLFNKTTTEEKAVIKENN